MKRTNSLPLSPVVLTRPYCRENRYFQVLRSKKTLQKKLKFSDCRESIPNKFGQVVEKSFESVLCLFGFVKAAKFRDSSGCSDCIQNV